MMLFFVSFVIPWNVKSDRLVGLLVQIIIAIVGYLDFILHGVPLWVLTTLAAVCSMLSVHAIGNIQSQINSDAADH